VLPDLVFGTSTDFGIFWGKKGHKLFLASGKTVKAFGGLFLAGKRLVLQL
jgi:hypothetical protein